MTRLVTPFVGASPELIGDPGHLAGQISGFQSGILTGSAYSTDREPPPKLLVAADARTIGEAAITWAPSSTRIRDAAAHDGTWSFDAKDLPPELLLENRITFTIRSTVQRSPLHSIDVVPSQFPTFADLKPDIGRLNGYVDGTENGIVRGWVWDPTDPLQRVKIALFIRGSFCGTYTADQWRSDLEASGRGDGRYGFSIPAQPFFDREASDAPPARVVALVPRVWEVPLAPHLSARTRRFAVPRLRDTAHTTRDLVTILTSAEPFPKKVHVIDRAVRRIPDAFAADYVHLAIEFLRIEMLKVPPQPSATLREHLVAWWRERVIHRQIHRLSTLATAIAASQSLAGGGPHGAADARSSHEQP